MTKSKKLPEGFVVQRSRTIFPPGFWENLFDGNWHILEQGSPVWDKDTDSESMLKHFKAKAKAAGLSLDTAINPQEPNKIAVCASKPEDGTQPNKPSRSTRGSNITRNRRGKK